MILFVIGTLDAGGAEGHLRLVLPLLKEKGFSPAVFALNHQGTYANELRSRGVPVHGAEQRVDRAKPQNSAKELVRISLAGARFIRFLRERDPAIVHFFLPEPYVVGGLCSLLAGRRSLLMSRRSLGCYQSRQALLARAERFLHRRMAGFLANSQAVVRDLIEVDGISAERIRLIYNGVSLEDHRGNRGGDRERQDARLCLGLAEQAFVMVKLANLIPYKGHMDLLRALRDAHSRLPAGWQLLCAGADQGIGQDLMAAAACFHIADNIQWLGSRADTSTLLAGADVGLLCSHEEGFSNAILEGMTVGLPMIVSDAGGNPEAIQDGDSGIVFPAGDVDRLGRAVLRLAGDPALRSRFGAAGRARVEREFSLHDCVERYARLYQELLTHDRLPDAGSDLTIPLSVSSRENRDTSR